MLVWYSQLREDLVAPTSVQCDSYRYDIHPATGKLTLTLLQQSGGQTKVLRVVTGVCQFWVDSV